MAQFIRSDMRDVEFLARLEDKDFRLRQIFMTEILADVHSLGISAGRLDLDWCSSFFHGVSSLSFDLNCIVDHRSSNSECFGTSSAVTGIRHQHLQEVESHEHLLQTPDE